MSDADAFQRRKHQCWISVVFALEIMHVRADLVERESGHCRKRTGAAVRTPFFSSAIRVRQIETDR